MAERRPGGGNTFALYSAIAVALIIGLGSAVTNFFNPKADIAASESREDASIKGIKEDFAKQFGELRADMVKFQNDVHWNYASKDLVTGKVDAIDKEKTSYRQGMERLIARIETKTNAIDTEIHGTYSPKDALASINNRIMELERALREKQTATISVQPAK